jgi:dTDP-4-amino-4,6-dideoxygalactose transaminase
MAQSFTIPFGRPYLTGREQTLINQALTEGYLHGNGHFTKKSQTELQTLTGCQKVLLTHSCTAALEMSVLLADIQPGDEVIMPSYTFVSTANAVVLQGGVPVFIDIRPDTLNIDENKIEEAITPLTKAIICVHYAGVACEMDTIRSIAKKHNLIVIEDAAQGVEAYYKNKALGTLGHSGAFSFHATKNIISGEGGALLVNDPEWIDRAEMIWEKGTNRKKFLLGQVDKYSWVDKGSSFLPGEVTAAFLVAQLESVKEITEQRVKIWNHYHHVLDALEKQEKLIRPTIPTDCQHNGHLYYILLKDGAQRNLLMNHLRQQGIQPATHYVPLHDSIAGQRFARTSGDLAVTCRVADTILRLPLFSELAESQIDFIGAEIEKFM